MLVSNDFQSDALIVIRLVPLESVTLYESLVHHTAILKLPTGISGSPLIFLLKETKDESVVVE